MTHSQQANPNPTNSEMDSKTLIKQPELTTQQWDDLIEQYTEIIVDGMDHKDMYRYVFDTISRDLRELESRQDLCDDIKYTFDEELLDELIDNVTNETVLDTNNTGGQF